MTAIVPPYDAGRLSPHFTLAELSATSVRDLDNTPGHEHVDNLRRLCEFALEPVRARFGPLYTTSGYRSPDVNRVIGGSPTSAHRDGRAWDGVPLDSQVKWADVMAYLQQNERIPLDQAIYEFGRWLHIGIAAPGRMCRRQTLMIFSGGKYEPWKSDDPRITR